jgi:phosphoglycolate phosphatase-like HAD superfamily hydrolase
MQTITIAFDIDGTLRNNQVPESAPVQANERIRALLIALSQLKNTRIIVWSGRGQAYATQMAHRLCVQPYVDGYASKNRQPGGSFAPAIRPHLAIDDIQDCDLGVVNLIVREK